MRTNLSLVDRFFSVLVQEIRRKEPSYLNSSFTVAEIYQSLVPYRTHRDVIGAEMNGDYEDALLRLLAGEGGYMTLESDTARERIRLELRSSNPNTGLYREYAAVGVRLVAERAEDVPGEDEEGDNRGQEESGGSRAQTELDVDDDELDAMVERTLDASDVSRLTNDLGLDDLLDEIPEERESEVAKTSGERGAKTTNGSAAESEKGESTSHPVPETTARGGPDPRGGSDRLSLEQIPDDLSQDAPPEDCPECETKLPQRDELRFCPFCGTHVFVAPCGACGEVLERTWSFCIACGESAA